MAAKRELLLIVHRVPYPPDKGDKIRSFNMLKFLVERDWLVHLCTLADNPADLQYAGQLQKNCASVAIMPLNKTLQKIRSVAAPLEGLPMSARYFYNKKLQRCVDEVIGKRPISAVLCYCSPMAEYVFRCGKKIREMGSDRPRLMMDFVDVDSDKWLQYANISNSPLRWLYLLESKLLRKYEQKVARFFDNSFLVSKAEAQVFSKITGINNRVHAMANGVDSDYFCLDPEKRKPERHSIVFCGAMDYLPNIDAVCWFAREVLPIVRQELPEANFTIVGGAPSKEIRELALLPGVSVTGRVLDVRPYVWSATLSVAPMRLARGIQNKVLEAMAMGKAVLTTPQGFEGIDAKPSVHLVVTQANSELFAASTIKLLIDHHKVDDLGDSARTIVTDLYSWPQKLRILVDILQRENK